MKHPVDTSAWGEFVTKDLFGPSQLGKYHNPKNLQESETGYPYICASNLNNGINTSMPYVTGDDLKPTPTNIISWGKQCPYFTYHDTPCITSQGMYYINVADYSKLQIDFIITVLTALTRKYNYTNCLIGKIFDELVLKLPLKPSANPSNYDHTDIDWDYMETVMSRVTTRAKERLANLPQPTDKKKTPVDTSAWGEFVTKDLFGPSQLGKYHNPKNLQESETGYPYICASNLNNGINTSMPYVTGDDLKPTPTNIISWGKQCPYFTYHDTPCITSQGMYYINVADYSKLQIDFIITVLTALTRKYNYTNCLIGKIFDELVLKLPLKPSANPSNYTQEDIDWDYMERFMQAIKEKAHERVASLRKQI